MNKQIIHLTPPSISQATIKEKIVCIRGHRERMFQISQEIVDNKLLCHNYGQGGAGWTFLFGCVNESLRQFEYQLEQDHKFHNTPITVIGAGCYGLLTAIMLARKGYDVRIVAKEVDNISSIKAAGFFFPRPRKSSTPQECAQFEKLGTISYATYLEIARGVHPFIKNGAQLMPCYYGLDIDPGFTPYISQGLMSSPQQVIIDFGASKKYKCLEYQTIFIQVSCIMKEFHRIRQEMNIKIVQQEIISFDQIPESIIFNCAGLGARTLTKDTKIIPVQGHLITLKDQHNLEQLQYMINFKVVMPSIKGTPRDELLYFAPKDNGILGITFMRGTDSLTANHHEFDRLLQRAGDFFGKI